jgi:hypothetical protein
MDEKKLAAAIAASILTFTEIGTQPKPSPSKESLTRDHILTTFKEYLKEIEKVL